MPDESTTERNQDSIDVDHLANIIRDALGMDDDETLIVSSSQHDRIDGVEPSEPPLTNLAMDRLKTLDKDTLAGMGLRKWSDETGVWLLPHEWHPHIPDDYPLTDILGDTEFRRDMGANPDKRFGVLAAGIVPDFEDPQERDSRIERVDND